MIGVIAREKQAPAAREFFELFKTPWEFYRESRTYDILLITENPKTLPHARLIFLFGPEKKHFDEENRIPVEFGDVRMFLSHFGSSFPVGLIL